MKRSPSKKGSSAERRKQPRSSSSKKKKLGASATPVQAVSEHACAQCAKELLPDDRALFVEEEVGRVFCEESCIASFFGSEIDRLEKEFFRRLAPNDLSAEEREKLAHLRWITLQEPDEIWREKTLSGDSRYTLMASYDPGETGAKKIWSVCICLFLRGEPSFLFLAFVSKNLAMVNHYRKGEQVEWAQVEAEKQKGEELRAAEEERVGREQLEASSDRLASPWTEDETYLARIGQERSTEDIPADEFGLYQSCLEESLEAPDEVWATGGKETEAEAAGEAESVADAAADTDADAATDDMRVYHFIRQYRQDTPSFWYVIIARETENEEELEILDAFPTRDPSLVARYRRGKQEVGDADGTPATRTVH